MEQMLQFEMNKEESDYLHRYEKDYDFNYFKQFLTEEEFDLFTKFGILSIEVVTPSGSCRTEGFRELLWALRYMITDKEKENWLYYLGTAINSINKENSLDNNYFVLNTMKKIVNGMGLKDELDKQIDFVYLREHDYNAFCKKYARSFLEYNDLTDEEKLERDKKNQEDKEFHKKCEREIL